MVRSCFERSSVVPTELTITAGTAVLQFQPQLFANCSRTSPESESHYIEVILVTIRETFLARLIIRVLTKLLPVNTRPVRRR